MATVECVDLKYKTFSINLIYLFDVEFPPHDDDVEMVQQLFSDAASNLNDAADKHFNEDDLIFSYADNVMEIEGILLHEIDMENLHIGLNLDFHNNVPKPITPEDFTKIGDALLDIVKAENSQTKLVYKTGHLVRIISPVR